MKIQIIAARVDSGFIIARTAANAIAMAHAIFLTARSLQSGVTMSQAIDRDRSAAAPLFRAHPCESRYVYLTDYEARSGTKESAEEVPMVVTYSIRRPIRRDGQRSARPERHTPRIREPFGARDGARDGARRFPKPHEDLLWREQQRVAVS